jgi:2-polyprenyl-3-methyl-5-hydroxy-6-metoxy-1,4-benzoquinol methylase
MTEIRTLSEPVQTGFVDEWYAVATEEHFWIQWRIAAFLRQLRDLGAETRKPAKVLDIGCGTGVACRQLEAHSRWDVDGAELTLHPLLLNQKRRGQILLYNINDRRPELAQAYDFILLFDVIEHIDDTPAFLDAALYHLKPGGGLFINVPALQSLKGAYDRAVGHLRRYDKDTMAEELNRHGLEIRDMRYWGVTMIPLLLLRNLLSSNQASAAETMRKGFVPPNRLINACLMLMMKLETSILAHPPAGSSLLAAAVKRG